MARKGFYTSIDVDIQNEFKDACKRHKVDMNDVLEAFMRDFVNDEYTARKEVKVILKKKEN